MEGEKMSPLMTVTETNLQSTMVSWDSPTDPENPKNWKNQRKWAITVLVSAFAFTTPMSSAMAAPALSLIAKDMNITSLTETNLVLSVFLLSYAFGAFILSPCSEIFGRRWVIQIGNLVFLIFNTACGFTRSQRAVIVMRVLAGLGGSANVGIGSGVISDCWSSEERGKGVSIYQLAPVLGPALAPILGGVLAQYASWQWTFWSISIFCGIIQMIAMLLLRETYAPKIIADKAKRLRKLYPEQIIYCAFDRQNLSEIFGISLIRPWRLILTQPIIQILSIYQAFNYGMLYLIITSFPELWEQHYGYSKAIASLNYLALLGSLLSSQISGIFSDNTYAYLIRTSKNHNGKGLPEYRIPMMVPATVIASLGIFLFGWSAEAKLHWIVPDLGIVLFSGASLTCYLCIQMYIMEAYPLYAASASSAAAVVRFLAAFAFPLMSPSLIKHLGYGLGGSVLGSISLIMGVPATLLLWKFGVRIRARSKYATD